MTLQKSHAFTPKNKLIRSTSYKTSDHRAIQAIISQGDFTKVPRRSSRYYYSVQTGECDICPIGLFKVGKTTWLHTGLFISIRAAGSYIANYATA